MFKLIIIFGICLIFSVSANTRDKRQAQQCNTPDNQIGICATLSRCQYLNNLYTQSRNNPQIINFLKAAQRNCGNRNIQREPVVCCAQNREPQSKNLSGKQKAEKLRKQVTQCTDPAGVQGVCKGLKDCRPILDSLQANSQNSSFAKYLRLSNEVCRLPPPTICCPGKEKEPESKSTLNGSEKINRIPTAAEGCGLSKNTFRKIVGGEPAKLGAWPWITLLGYTDSFGKRSFRCGGVLVTQRHVLTAAHCILSQLTFIRLGEHDLNSETETSYVDINIVKKVRHSSYLKDDGHSDVGVLQLERNAPFTDFIRPICLPNTPQLRAKSYVNFKPFVSGWGRTQYRGNTSPILQELQVSIQGNEVCANGYKNLGYKVTDRQFDEGIVCAGVLAGGKDTCQGDSGGPLMIPESDGDGGIRFYAIGIISYGAIGCGQQIVPSVYANVSQFMPWIEEQIADNS